LSSYLMYRQRFFSFVVAHRSSRQLCQVVAQIHSSPSQFVKIQNTTLIIHPPITSERNMLKPTLLSLALIGFAIGVSAESANASLVSKVAVAASSIERVLDDRKPDVDIPERNANNDYVFPNTSSPTDSPAPSLTASPSASPNDEPVNPCTSNGDGSFGDTSSINVEVEYNYEMVTEPDADVGETLSNLESAISDLILGSSLVTCGSRRNLKVSLRQRKLQGELDGLVGLSSSPPDVLKTDKGKILRYHCI